MNIDGLIKLFTQILMIQHHNMKSPYLIININKGERVHFIVYTVYLNLRANYNWKLKQTNGHHLKDPINIINGSYLQIRDLLTYKQKPKIIYKNNISKNNIDKSNHNIIIWLDNQNI